MRNLLYKNQFGVGNFRGIFDARRYAGLDSPCVSGAFFPTAEGRPLGWYKGYDQQKNGYKFGQCFHIISLAYMV